MSAIEIASLGEIIRRVRREKSLRLEDLADENISPATISNIERGVPNVSRQKIQYLLKKLEIDMERLPELMVDEQKKMKDLRFRLFSMEYLRDMGQPETALNEIKNLDIDDDHLLAPELYFITGKCHYSLNKWEKAERAFFQAIHLAGQYGDTNNVEAASFVFLGLISYKRNDLEQAISYTKSGIDAFQDNGKRLNYKYVLYQNKVMYLDRLGRWGEALRVVEEIWPQMEEMEQSEVILGFYHMRSDLLRKTGDYDKAEGCALEGLEKARMNRNHFRSFDLWTTLGNIHMAQGNMDKAAHDYHIALSLKNQFENQVVTTRTYACLAILHLRNKEWNPAFEYAQKAVRVAEEYNNVPRLVSALMVMGDVWRLQGKPNEAIPHYQRAEELSRELHLNKRQYHALFRLAQCWENIDKQEFQKCMRNMYEVKKEMQREVDDFDEME